MWANLLVMVYADPELDFVYQRFSVNILLTYLYILIIFD